MAGELEEGPSGEQALLTGVGKLTASPSISARLTGVGRLVPLISIPDARLTGVGRLYNTENPTGVDTPGVPLGDWDIRGYDKDGKRIHIHKEKVVSFDFSYYERGGWEQGNLILSQEYDPNAFNLTEYIEVWLFGQRMFRGLAKTVNNPTHPNEHLTVGVYGLFTMLRRFTVRRHFCYSTERNVSDVFTDLVTAYAIGADRIPTAIIEVEDVESLGLTVQEFNAEGQQLDEAINSLCDLFPGVLQWGVDIGIQAGQEVLRIYIRRKPDTVLYHYAIVEGGNVTGYATPKTGLEIVNRIFLTGGKLNNGNLVTNGGLQECIIADEQHGNLLYNPSFEIASTEEFPDGWELLYRARQHDANNFPDQARTGIAWMELDNYNEGGPEAFWQDVPAYGNLDITMSIWAAQEVVSGGMGFRMALQILDVDFNILATAISPFFTPPFNGNYERFEYNYDFGTLSNAAWIRYYVEVSALASQDNGVIFDDAALWTGQAVLNGWKVGRNVNARITYLDWFSTGASYYGDTSIEITSDVNTGGYTEISNTQDGRVSVEKNTTYTVGVYLRALSGIQSATIGVRLYNGETEQDTIHGTATIIPVDGNFHLLAIYNARSFSDTTHFEVFVRFHDDGTMYIGAFVVYKGDLPDTFTPSDNYERVFSTDDFTNLEIGDEAADSIPTYDIHEKPESNDSIVDDAAAEEFAKDYFRENAVPAIEGTLQITNAQSPQFLDGQIRVVNLLNAPNPLTPVRVQYTLKESIVIDIELNREKPSYQSVLRRLQKGKI